MNFSIKNWFQNYFKKKKPLSIFIDVAFIILILLLVIPGTRTTVGSFFIRLTSFPPSALDKNEQVLIGNSARNWTVYDFSGNQVNFSDLNSKPVFINFWATWCPPCVAELPGIQEIYEQYKERVNFILVTNEDEEIVKTFLKNHQYENMPVYFAANTPVEFSTNSIPASFVLSRDGRIVLSKKGAARWNTGSTSDLLDQLINE